MDGKAAVINETIAKVSHTHRLGVEVPSTRMRTARSGEMQAAAEQQKTLRPLCSSRSSLRSRQKTPSTEHPAPIDLKWKMATNCIWIVYEFSLILLFRCKLYTLFDFQRWFSKKKKNRSEIRTLLSFRWDSVSEIRTIQKVEESDGWRIHSGGRKQSSTMFVFTEVVSGWNRSIRNENKQLAMNAIHADPSDRGTNIEQKNKTYSACRLWKSGSRSTGWNEFSIDWVYREQMRACHCSFCVR